MKKELNKFSKYTRWLVLIAIFAFVCSMASLLTVKENNSPLASEHECYLLGDSYGIGQADVDNLLAYIKTPELIGLTPSNEPYRYHLKENVSWEGTFVAPDGVYMAICLNGYTASGAIDNDSSTGGIFFVQCGTHDCLEMGGTYVTVGQSFFDAMAKFFEGAGSVDVEMSVGLSESVALGEDWVLSSTSNLRVCTNGYDFNYSDNITQNGGSLTVCDCSLLHDCYYFGDSAIRATKEMVEGMLLAERTPEAWGMPASSEPYCAYISEDLDWDGVLSAPDGVYIALCLNGHEILGEIDNSKTKNGGIFVMQCGVHTCLISGETTIELSNGYVQLMEAIMSDAGQTIDFGTGVCVALNSDITFTKPEVWAMPNTSSIVICTGGHTITNLDYLTVNGGVVNLVDCSNIGKHSCEYLQGETAEYLTQNGLSALVNDSGVLKGSNKQTLCLLGNINLSKTLVIPTGKELTLCLNGFSLISPPIIWGQQGLGGEEINICRTAITVMEGASLTICDCSAHQSGRVVVNFEEMNGWGALAASAIINSGELNVKSGKLIGVMSVLNAGDVVMDGGEIVGLIAGITQSCDIIDEVGSNLDASFVLNGGEIHSAAAGVIAENGDVIVNGGLIVSQAVGIGSSFDLEKPSGTAVIYLNGGEITTGRVESSAYKEAGLPIDDGGIGIESDYCVGVMSNTTIVFGGDVVINMEGDVVENADYTADILMSGQTNVILADGAQIENVYEIAVENSTDAVHVDPSLEAHVVPAQGVIVQTNENGDDKIILNDGSIVCNASVYAVSVSLKGSLVVNVYVDAEDEFVNNPNSKVKFLYKGVVYEYSIEEATKSEDKYVFSLEVSAKDYQKNITCNFSDGVHSWYGGSLTINKYLLKIINYENTAKSVVITDEQKELAKRVQNYCMAASYHFGISTEYNPDETIASEMDEVTKDTLESYGAIVEGASDKIRFAGASVFLQSSTTVRFYFYVKEGYNISDVIIKIGDKVVPAVKDENSSAYYVEVKNIRAQDLDMRILLDIDGYKVNYCALSYAYSVLKTPGMAQDLVNVAKSLYVYYKYSEAYFNRGEV